MEPSREQLIAALGNVIDPELKRPVTELDMVREVNVDGMATSRSRSRSPSPVARCVDSFERQVREHVLPLPGVESVSLAST